MSRRLTTSASARQAQTPPGAPVTEPSGPHLSCVAMHDGVIVRKHQELKCDPLGSSTDPREREGGREGERRREREREREIEKERSSHVQIEIERQRERERERER